MAERAPDYIISDLATKLDADVLAALTRTAMLVEHPSDRAALAVLAVGGALGFGVRFFEEVMPGTFTKEELVDALWKTRLRPSVMEGLNDVTSGRAILLKAQGRAIDTDGGGVR